jgi:pilus assembly protein CpaE
MTEMKTLRILLVDDSAETREYLRKLLQFESHIEVVGVAGNGRDAVNLALEVKPDLILMDINMPVMDGISAAEIIFREMPSVRVVMMSVQSEMGYLRRAMQVGAREFLIKPFTHDELLNILGQVSSLEPTPAETGYARPGVEMVAPAVKKVKRGSLVAVFSPRGGAGSSTVALNLAIALQGQRKAAVILIDGNFRFGALDTLLNLQVKRSIADILPSLGDAEPEVLHSATLPHTTGIRLLAAPLRPEEADLVSAEKVRELVTLAQQCYDYVVVDLGSNLDDRALCFLDTADCTVVLLVPDIPAVKNTRLFIEVAQGLGYDLEKILLVLNRANPRGGINAAAIQRHLKLPIVATIPDSPRVAHTAINRGVPLILYEREVNREMPVARQLLALADKVPEPGESLVEPAPAERIQGAEEGVPQAARAPQPEKKGIIDRLFGKRR